jgi:hypothetical protein
MPSQLPPSNNAGSIADGGAAQLADDGSAEQPQLRDDPQAAAKARSGGGDPGHSLHPLETLASG